MLKIVFSHNEYYLYDGFNFYGPYHSIADAEAATKIADARSNDFFIKNKYLGLIMI